MKIHELKIKAEYAYDVMVENKRFELRKNDRDFQVGDLVKFKVFFDSKHIDDFLFSDTRAIEDNIYKITYILKDVPEYGLNKDYCILSITRLVETT